MENAAEIAGNVRDFSPVAAARLELQFMDVAETLATFPERGRPIGRGRREILVVKPYVIRYVVVAEEVRILSVRHGATRPPGQALAATLNRCRSARTHAMYGDAPAILDGRAPNMETDPP